MNVLLLRGTPSPKRIRGTFLRHEPTRRTSFYAAHRALNFGGYGPNVDAFRVKKEIIQATYTADEAQSGVHEV
jgi:hypothetical protein